MKLDSITEDTETCPDEDLIYHQIRAIVEVAKAINRLGYVVLLSAAVIAYTISQVF